MLASLSVGLLAVALILCFLLVLASVMVCDDPFDILRVRTEDLAMDVMRYAQQRNIWLNLIQKGTYPHGTGVTRSVFYMGDSEPTTDEETWESITLVEGRVDPTCDKTFNTVDVGWDELTYGPERFLLSSKEFCRDEIIYSFNAGVFLEAIRDKLAMNYRRRWENRYAKIYIENSRKAVILSSGSGTLDITDQADYTALPEAECGLTQAHLDRIAAELNLTDAPEPDATGYTQLGPQGPIYSLYIGQMASARIVQNNSEFRQDVRYAEPSEFMRRIGATTVIKNFRHIHYPFPPRYTWDGANYVRVNTFSNVSGTKGTRQVVSTAYQNATHEAALVLSDRVFTSEIVPPLNRVNDLTFDPSNYAGEMELVVGAYKWNADCADPLGDRAKWFVQYAHAPRPMKGRFKYAYWIVYKLCDDEVECPCSPAIS